MKKNLKLITFSAILLMLAGSFFSCGEKEQPLEPFLTVDETPISATTEARTYSIAVGSDGAWTAIVENADWCTLNKSTGNGDDILIVNVAENMLYTTRSAIVKITSGSLTKSVVISQNAAEEPEEEPFLIVDETPITAAADAGTYSIAVNSNNDWTAVVENADWCMLDNNSCSSDGAITVNVAKNTFYTERSATVKITSGNLTKSVIINQSAAECTECPHSVWKCADYTNVIIEVTFYPSLKLMQMKTTPENLPTPPYLFFNGASIEYRITDNKMYWKDGNGEFHPNFYFNLSYPSKNEMVMIYAGRMAQDMLYNTVYHFICQTEFNEL